MSRQNADNPIAFGFPNAPELAVGEQNPGFLDQRMALDWTSKNIKAFGGMLVPEIVIEQIT